MRWPRLDQRGTIDLPSIMISALVTVLLSVGGFFTVDTIVPWQQDRSTKTGLSAVAPAQQSSMSATGSFELLDTLVAKGWLEAKPAGVKTSLGNGGTCFASVAVSGSGTVMVDEGAGIVELGGSTYTSGCLSTAQIRSLVSSAGGPANWSKVQGVLPAPSGLSYNKTNRLISWSALSGATGYQVEVHCGSNLAAAAKHKVFTASTSNTLPTSACPASTPMTVNVWATSAMNGKPTSLVAGLGATR